MSIFFFASFFLYYYLFFLHPTKTIFSRKRWCLKFPFFFFLKFPCFLVFRRIGEYISLVLFYQFCQPPGVVHSFLRRRKNVYLHIHEITQVVVLYTSLQLVEGVYKPQWACVGWASVTESCLETCMWIKHTCLDEFPPGHPKTFERTLDNISLFVLAFSNTINLFPNFLCCSYENVRKMKLFHTDCPDLKPKHWQK